jgi:hypothetical protein
MEQIESKSNVLTAAICGQSSAEGSANNAFKGSLDNGEVGDKIKRNRFRAKSVAPFFGADLFEYPRLAPFRTDRELVTLNLEAACRLLLRSRDSLLWTPDVGKLL